MIRSNERSTIQILRIRIYVWYRRSCGCEAENAYLYSRGYRRAVFKLFTPKHLSCARGSARFRLNSGRPWSRPRLLLNPVDIETLQKSKIRARAIIRGLS
jgi:hypothetical protein